MDYFKWLCSQLGNICVMCDKVFPQGKLTIDHIKPITKGGKHSNANVQPLCGPCNARKGNKVVFSDPRIPLLYFQYSCGIL